MLKKFSKYTITVLAVACVMGLLGRIPDAQSQFAQQATYAGTSTGSTSAQDITFPNVDSMARLLGVTFSWKVGAGIGNNGPSTLTVNSLSSVPIERLNGGALVALAGGEMPAGDVVQAYWDGTEVVLTTNYTGSDPVGSEKIIAYATADPGYLLENGACVNETGAAAVLFAKIGTTYSTQDGCTGSQFGLPDKRARAIIGLDGMGGSSTTSRITSGIGGITATTLGAVGGSQGFSAGLPQSDLQSFSLSGSGSGSTTPATATGTTTSPVATNEGSAAAAGGGCCYWGGGTASVSVTVPSLAVSVGVSVASGGGGAPFSTTVPGQVSAVEIKL